MGVVLLVMVATFAISFRSIHPRIELSTSASAPQSLRDADTDPAGAGKGTIRASVVLQWTVALESGVLWGGSPSLKTPSAASERKVFSPLPVEDCRGAKNNHIGGALVACDVGEKTTPKEQTWTSRNLKA